KEVTAVYYGKHSSTLAVKDVTQSVNEGEFISIIGPSGCGKSTLLKIVSGLLQPTKGEVYIKGIKVEGPQPGIGMAFQDPNLLPWRTAIKNVLLPIEILKEDLDKYKKKALELFKLVNLSGFEEKYPWELSGGMQQRVSLIRALIHEPDILLLDEPFGALDALTREEMNLELQKIWMAKKRTILFVTHSIQEAVFLSDRVVVMSPRPGTIVHEEKIELKRPRSLEMIGNPEFVKYINSLRFKLGLKGDQNNEW
ncbi:MAG: ABC transporter ATP-binding protein, partial [Candidatus Bathyarchaeia archaeon]